MEPPIPGNPDRPTGASMARRRDRTAGLLGLAAIALFVGGGVFLRRMVQSKVEQGRTQCVQLLAGALALPEGASSSDAFRKASQCYADLLRAKPFSTEFAFRAQACEDLGLFRSGGGELGKGDLSKVGPEFKAAFGELAAGQFAAAAEHFAALGRGEGPDRDAAARYGDLAKDLARLVAGPSGAD